MDISRHRDGPGNDDDSGNKGLRIVRGGGHRARVCSRRLRLLIALAAFAAPLVPGAAQAYVNPVLAGAVSDSETLPLVDAAAVAGHYAYVPDYYAGRVSAIDISLPSSPFIAGSSASSSALMNGSTINIAGGYAFVAAKNRNGPCLPGPNPTCSEGTNDNGSGNSLTILDIHTNPAEPQIVGTVHDPATLFGAYGVAVSGNYAYVAAQGCLSGQPCPSHVGNDLDVIEINGAEGPKIVGTVGGGEGFGHVTSVAISGHYAYLTAFYYHRLTVVNIAEPQSPKLVASLSDPTHFPDPADVAISGNTAYVINQDGAGTLASVDISHPSEPKVVGSLTSHELGGGYRIRLRGDMAYVAASSAADVAIMDISNPLAPRLLASYKDPKRLHFTTGLDLDETGAYVVAVSPLLETQHQPLYPPYPLEPEGPEITGTVSVITLDPEPVQVSIAGASRPPNPTTQTAASFGFSVNDAVATVQCRLDHGEWGPCTTPTSQTYTQLSTGAHAFEVQAADSAGNTSTAGYSWTVTAPPQTTTPPSSGGGGPTSPGGGTGQSSPEAIPTAASIRAALLAVLLPGGKAAHVASVRKHHGYQLTFNAPGRGEVVIWWYWLPKGAHLASAKPVLLAWGRAAVTSKGPVKVTLGLTERGTRLLRHGRDVKLTALGAFTPPGAAPVILIRPFTLR
jgi:hypothetical protein